MIRRRPLVFIDCSEAAKCCDKTQYAESTPSEKFRMLLHMLFCRRCRRYSALNNKLTRLIYKADLKTCTEKEKKAMKEKIREEITK